MEFFNLVVLAGRLAAPVEIRTTESGSRLARLLITVCSTDPPRRVDVVPVTVWDPNESLVSEPPKPGRLMWISGAVQRRFWESIDGRRSRLEVVARHVEVQDDGHDGEDAAA
jgi:single-stranded DNA-binding protein